MSNAHTNRQIRHKEKNGNSNRKNKGETIGQFYLEEESTWKKQVRDFAISAGLTLMQGALFALGGLTARSTVD